jgi:hypothetical protein
VVKASTDMRQMEVKLPNRDECALGGHVAEVMNIHIISFCAHYFMTDVGKKITGNLNHLGLTTGIFNHKSKLWYIIYCGE